MLRFFLFKPVITIIEHEKMQENSMLDVINQQIKSLEIQEKERQRHWFICQEYFKTNQPPLIEKTMLLAEDGENPSIAYTTPESIAHIIAETHGIIEEKIKHVH